MRTFVRAAVFHAIQIVWFPIGFVAYFPFVILLIAHSRKTGVSSTAWSSLYTRWMQHHLGTRPDEPCVRLINAMPALFRLALPLLMNGTLLGYRGTTPATAAVERNRSPRTCLPRNAVRMHLSRRGTGAAQPDG